MYYHTLDSDLGVQGMGTSSGSEFQSHAILLTWLIVVGFSPKLLRRIGMVRFIYLRRHLGTIPPSFFLTDTATLAWDRPIRGHIQKTTIRQLLRSAQGAPVTPFGDRRRPLLRDLGEKPTTISQGTATSAADPAASLLEKRFKSDNSEPWHTPLR